MAVWAEIFCFPFPIESENNRRHCCLLVKNDLSLFYRSSGQDESLYQLLELNYLISQFLYSVDIISNLIVLVDVSCKFCKPVQSSRRRSLRFPQHLVVAAPVPAVWRDTLTGWHGSVSHPCDGDLGAAFLVGVQRVADCLVWCWVDTGNCFRHPLWRTTS